MKELQINLSLNIAVQGHNDMFCHEDCDYFNHRIVGKNCIDMTLCELFRQHLFINHSLNMLEDEVTGEKKFRYVRCRDCKYVQPAQETK